MSFCPSIRLFAQAFSRNRWGIFSKLCHDVKNSYEVFAWLGFSEKNICRRNGENRSKMGLFQFIEKFGRYFFLICSIIKLFYFKCNIVIIYNTRNWRNDTTESQKEKMACSDAYAGGKWNLTVQCYSKQTNKMLSLKILLMLKCGTRTSLYAIQYKWQPGSVLMFCHFRNG